MRNASCLHSCLSPLGTARPCAVNILIALEHPNIVDLKGGCCASAQASNCCLQTKQQATPGGALRPLSPQCHQNSRRHTACLWPACAILHCTGVMRRLLPSNDSLSGPAAVVVPPTAAECFFAGRPNLVRRSVQSLFAQPFSPLSDDGEQGWRRHRECAWHEAQGIRALLQAALGVKPLYTPPYVRGPHIYEASPLVRPPLRPCRGRRLWREGVSDHGGAARYGPAALRACKSCGVSGQIAGCAAVKRHRAPVPCLLSSLHCVWLQAVSCWMQSWPRDPIPRAMHGPSSARL